MAEIYFYVGSNAAENAVECGLKLSEHASKYVVINEEVRKCITAFLNPKDDMEKYKSMDYKCLKFELPSKFCFVGDSYLYKAGLACPEVMKIYLNTIVPINNYIFGSFRLPECLITTTLLPGQISILDKRLDSPVLFDNSEEFYINNIIEINREENGDFNDAMLYCYYGTLARQNKLKKIEDNSKNIAVFIDESRNKTISIKIPDVLKD